jgi:hypothetical protein
VLLVGQMASGKTTIASVLVDQGYTKLAFADGVKTIAAMAYGNIQKGSMYEIHDIHQGYMEVTGREILQRVGQEIKLIDQDFWLKIIEQKMAGGGPFVIDDGRFDFELEWARKRGFMVVGVNTPEPARIQRYQIVYGRTPSPQELSHQSEAQVPQLLLQCDMNVQGTDDPYMNARRVKDYAGQNSHIGSGYTMSSMWNDRQSQDTARV